MGDGSSSLELSPYHRASARGRESRVVLIEAPSLRQPEQTRLGCHHSRLPDRDPRQTEVGCLVRAPHPAPERVKVKGAMWLHLRKRVMYRRCWAFALGSCGVATHSTGF